MWNYRHFYWLSKPHNTYNQTHTSSQKTSIVSTNSISTSIDHPHNIITLKNYQPLSYISYSPHLITVQKVELTQTFKKMMNLINLLNLDPKTNHHPTSLAFPYWQKGHITLPNMLALSATSNETSKYLDICLHMRHNPISIR